MKKEYPDRYQFDDGNSVWWDDTCECGHDWGVHRSYFWKCLLSLFGDVTKSLGKCNTCECPQYKRDESVVSDRRMCGTWDMYKRV